jgi:hypothetical protein
MDVVTIERHAADDRVGLCATCTHAQRVVSSKGSIFFLCRLADTDDRFRKYPVLPVRSCSGYAAAAAAD